MLDDPKLADAFLVYPEFDEQGRHPFHFQTIREYQQQSPALLEAALNAPGRYQTKQFNGIDVICFLPEGQPLNWKIAIPDNMLNKLVAWYHETLVHAVGMERLKETINSHFHHPRLREAVRRHIQNCEPCQRFKRGNRQYGQLPPREAPYAPWSEIHVDLVGPWDVTVNGITLYFNALTIIDPVTNLLEIARIQEKSAYHVGLQLEIGWLSRYPRPTRCVHDQGPEFVGKAFQDMLANAGIQDIPTTVKNPQSNAICERVHQTVAQVLRTLVHLYPPADMLEASDLIDRALATAQFAARNAATSSIMNNTPGALAFQRDMLLDIPLIADFITIRDNRQAVIDERLRQANHRRVSHDYQIGERVFLKNEQAKKMESMWLGPYPIEQVHANGNVTLRISQNVTDRVNIRRVKPFRSAD
jgi:transposase InsO family protein